MSRLGAALLAVVLGAVLTLSTASPAAAAPAATVTTVVGDRYTPGEPVAFLVEITANKATEGTITVRVDGRDTTTKEFEVAGGATKTVVVVTESLQWGPGFALSIQSSDGDVTLRPRLAEDRESENVGLLASLQDSGLPNTAPAATGGRTARFHPISELILQSDPRALSMFDSIAGTPDDFAGLAADDTRSIRDWLVRGGNLLIDAEPGSAVIGLEGLDGNSLGFGTVEYTGGELRRGSADRLIPATSGAGFDEIGVPIDPADSGRALVADAGIRVPGIGLLLALVGGYILLVGPVLFLILRRTERLPLAWGAIPAIALLAVGSVWMVGRAQRSNVGLAHGTIVAYTDGLRIDHSEVLVASANGGYVGLATDGEFTSVGSSFDRFGNIAGKRLDRRDDSIGVQLNPGEATRITVERVVETRDQPPLTLSTTIEDRTVTGSVTNTGNLPLEDVRVGSGNATQLIGLMEPGESAEIALDQDFATIPLQDDTFFARMDQGFFDPFNGQPEDRGLGDLPAVNAGVIAEFTTRYGSLRDTGRVMALGWTREAEAPIRTDSGSAIDRGRTGYLTVERPTTQNGAPVAYGEASVSLLRMLFENDLNDQGRGPTEFSAELLYTLPADADPTQPLVIELSNQVAGIDMWTGSWDPVSERTLAGLNPEVIPVDPQWIVNGRLQLRAGINGFNRVRVPVLRSANAEELAQMNQPPADDETDDEEAGA